MFPFPWSLGAPKAPQYKLEAYCNTNGRCIAILFWEVVVVGVSDILLTFFTNRNRNRNPGQPPKLYWNTQKTLSTEEPSEPKTGTARSVPCPNLKQTEPKRGHLEFLTFQEISHLNFSLARAGLDLWKTRPATDRQWENNDICLKRDYKGTFAPPFKVTHKRQTMTPMRVSDIFETLS